MRWKTMSEELTRDEYEAKIAELTKEAFDRVEKLDGDVKAFLALNKEQATAQAAEMDKVPFWKRKKAW